MYFVFFFPLSSDVFVTDVRGGRSISRLRTIFVFRFLVPSITFAGFLDSGASVLLRARSKERNTETRLRNKQRMFAWPAVCAT